MTRWHEALTRARAEASDDEGTTLMELVVGMMIGLIFLGMFTGAIVLLYQSSNRDNALTASSRQTDSAFSHLDRTLRYASKISTPAFKNGTWYVEFLTRATGPQVCTQLRINTTTQNLEARTVTVSSTGALGTPSPFTPWASGITNGTAAAGASQPFILLPAGSVNYEQLQVQLVATSGSPAITASTNAVFTALNSSTAAAANTGVQTACSLDQP